MHLSGEMQERLRRALESDPLKEGELRRIEGMGELYIALSETEVEERQLQRLYSLKIGEIEYQVLSKITNGK